MNECHTNHDKQKEEIMKVFISIVNIANA